MENTKQSNFLYILEENESVSFNIQKQKRNIKVMELAKSLVRRQKIEENLRINRIKKKAKTNYPYEEESKENTQNPMLFTPNLEEEENIDSPTFYKDAVTDEVMGEEKRQKNAFQIFSETCKLRALNWLKNFSLSHH